MKNRNSRLREKCGLDFEGFVSLSKKKKKKERILPPKKKEIEVLVYKTKYHDQITCFVIVMILTII